MAVQTVHPSAVINFSNQFEFYQNNDIEFEEDIHEIQSVPNNHKTKTYSLFDNREEIKVPLDILNRAEQISQKMERAIHNRKGRRKRRQFACLYYAHLELGVKIFSPHGIADIVGLPYDEISPAITDFSPLLSGYKPVRRSNDGNHPSIRIAADYARSLGLSESEIEHISLVIQDAITSDPKIKTRKTTTIAIGGIAAFVHISNKDIDLRKLYEVSKISESTIKQTRGQMLAAYNA